MTDIYAYGLGCGTLNAQGEWLEIWYPQPQLGADQTLYDLLKNWIDHSGKPLDSPAVSRLADQLKMEGFTAQAALLDQLAGGKGSAVICILADNSGPTDVPSAYLKLHMLSHRLVRPHGTDLTGIFACLPNVAWTSEGAIDISELEQRRMQARAKGQSLVVNSVDKFPRMTDYVVPTGVRIGDASRIRLGAYLGEGTTVMHEGFINFNAGCEGPNMIEGRISAGVFVSAGSDLGAGCSTMGTLSGGGNVVISVGRECLIGANAGLGIPLGDRCTIEAGLYITAGTKVRLLDDQGAEVKIVKAAELAGQPGLLFWRNSLTGAVECRANRSAVELNESLHSHN
jgi:2,3,4,5-tetrahydropyridine-2,6-dicarboxylate N-succinyltransferase